MRLDGPDRVLDCTNARGENLIRGVVTSEGRLGWEARREAKGGWRFFPWVDVDGPASNRRRYLRNLHTLVANQVKKS